MFLPIYIIWVCTLVTSIQGEFTQGKFLVKYFGVNWNFKEKVNFLKTEHEKIENIMIISKRV